MLVKPSRVECGWGSLACCSHGPQKWPQLEANWTPLSCCGRQDQIPSEDASLGPCPRCCLYHHSLLQCTVAELFLLLVSSGRSDLFAWSSQFMNAFVSVFSCAYYYLFPLHPARIILSIQSWYLSLFLDYKHINAFLLEKNTLAPGKVAVLIFKFSLFMLAYFKVLSSHSRCFSMTH